MRRVSKHLAVLSFFFVMIAHSAAAAPPNSSRGDASDWAWASRLKHFIVRVLDQLGVPKP